jgi:hypothetical protein
MIHGHLEPLLHLCGDLVFHVKHRRRQGDQLLLLFGGGVCVLHQEFPDGLDVFPGDIPHLVFLVGLEHPGGQDDGQHQADAHQQQDLGVSILAARAAAFAD